MPQIKIYARAEFVAQYRGELSDAIHSAIVDVLATPPEKRFQRFVPMAAEDFVYPDDRSERYTIIEVSMFEGRAEETKRKLIRMLYERLGERVGPGPRDVEITIFETPVRNWGINGAPADEKPLNYEVNV